MKILQTGESQIPWVGHIFDCPTCGEEIQLEQGDDKSSFVCIREMVLVSCPNCSTNMIERKPQ